FSGAGNTGAPGRITGGSSRTSLRPTGAPPGGLENERAAHVVSVGFNAYFVRGSCCHSNFSFLFNLHETADRGRSRRATIGTGRRPTHFPRRVRRVWPIPRCRGRRVLLGVPGELDDRPLP